MKSYSVTARSFLYLLWCLGLLTIYATLRLPPPPGDRFVPLYVCGAIALAAVAARCKVHLLRSKRQGESHYVTLGFLVTFGTLLALGIRAGVLVGVISAVIADLYPRRNALHQLLFNASSVAIAAWCSGQTFALLNGSVGHIQSSSLIPLLIAITVYFVLNAGSLACILALVHRQPLRGVWRTGFFRAFPLHLTGAAYIALAIMFINDGNIILLGLGLLTVPFALQYYRMYRDQQRLNDELEAGREMMGEMYLSTVKSLATAIAAKDQYTHAHIHRVQRHAVAIAEKLGVEGDELEAIRTGAVLHDIGKLGVPDYVLLKPGKLSPDEFAKMKRHPVVGANILEPVNFPWPVAGVVRHHHERWDGTGYPDNLAGEDIPRSARILSVADVYDALTSNRPYRAAWTHEKTIAFLRAESAIQFDPRVVEAFLEVVDSTNATLQALDMATASAESESGQASSYNNASDASRQIGRTASELWVLYEVSQALSSAAPMQQRLTLLGQKLTAILRGTTCAFLLYETPTDIAQRELNLKGLLSLPGLLSPSPDSRESEQPCLRVYAAAGPNADVLYANPVMDANGPSSRAARERKMVRGAYTDDGLTWSMSQDLERPLRSLLIVPLVHEGETLGAMTFYHGNADAFSADDEHLLSIIAEQVQTALYQEREYDRTRSDANTDALTGLNNMRYLRQKTASALLAPASAGETFMLLYLDLDNFKNVNTVYGHPLGSRVLRDVAQLLPRELRPTDIAIRYGGDEFVIVLPQTSEAGAREVASRIRAAIQKYRPAFLTTFDSACALDVSIGLACYPYDGSSMEELVAVADRRMYQVKTVQKHSDSPPLPEREYGVHSRSFCLETAIVAGIMEKWSGVRG